MSEHLEKYSTFSFLLFFLEADSKADSPFCLEGVGRETDTVVLVTLNNMFQQAEH